MAVSCIVQCLELGRIEEAIRAHAAIGQEVADFVAAEAEIDVGSRRLERSVTRCQRAGRLCRVEPRLGDDADDQRILVAEFRLGNARDELHRLYRVGGNLVRVHAALLIGDRLVID